MKKCLIYCRVSTLTQEEKGTSLETQAAACIEYAEAGGFEIAEIVKETYSGAYLFERPKLNECRAKIRNGEYDVVIAYAIDRLSRDIAHLALLSSEIERYGGELHFVTEQLDQTPEGKLMLSVKSYVAEVERQKIRERSMRGRKAKIDSGKLIKSSCELYGYRMDVETGKRKIIESEAAIVRRIFAEYLSGKSIRSIYIDLSKENIPTPGQGQKQFKNTGHFVNVGLFGKTLWGSGSIHRILRQIAYTGKTYANMYKSVEKFNNGNRRTTSVLQPESEWIELPGDITPPIISIEDFNAVKLRLSVNKGASTRNKLRPILLRGMVSCFCSHKFYSVLERKTLAFRCGSIRHGKSCKLPGAWIRVEKLDNIVWNEIKKIILNPEYLLSELKSARSQKQSESEGLLTEIKENETALKKIDVELSRLLSRAGELDESLWSLIQNEIENKTGEKKKLTRTLEQNKNLLRSRRRENYGLNNIKAVCSGFAEKLDNATFEVKRLIFESLGVQVICSSKLVELYVSFVLYNDSDVNMLQKPSFYNNYHGRRRHGDTDRTRRVTVF